MNDITIISIITKSHYFQADMDRLFALKILLDATILSNMDNFWVNELLPFSTDKNSKEIDAWLDSEKNELKKLFRFTILSSIFTTAYYHLENEILFFSQILAKDLNMEKELDQIDDKGIKKARSFLKKLKVEIPNQWSEIVNYGRIRNAIAHTAGIAKKDALLDYINRTKNIDVDDINRIIFSDNFIEKAFNNIQTFEHKLVENIKNA
ncbi:MAG: hypothetical protein WD357_05920 [Gracilimonas sp.]